MFYSLILLTITQKRKGARFNGRSEQAAREIKKKGSAYLRLILDDIPKASDPLAKQ